MDQLPSVTPLGIRGSRYLGSSALVKRGFDLLGSALGLILLSPLLIVIVIAIKLDSPGPVLFRQRRVGMHGRAVVLLKFRSMVTEGSAAAGGKIGGWHRPRWMSSRA